MITVLRWRQPTPAILLRWRGPDQKMAAAAAFPPLMPLTAIIGPPGERGPAGGGGGGGSSLVAVNGETPAGAVNGVNTAFTLAQAPTFLILFVDGVRMNKGAGKDYTLAGNQITMLYPLQIGQVPSADYLY